MRRKKGENETGPRTFGARMKTLAARWSPSKTKRTAVLSGLKTSVQIADTVANVSSITTLQAITGAVCKVIEYCEAIKDNREQALELEHVARDILATLYAASDALQEQENEEQVQEDMDSLSRALSSVMKETLSIVKSSKLKRLLNAKSDAARIRNCTSRLKTACDRAQIKYICAVRIELGSVSNAIRDTAARVRIGNERIAQVEQCVALVDKRTATIDRRVTAVLESVTAPRAEATQLDLIFHGTISNPSGRQAMPGLNERHKKLLFLAVALVQVFDLEQQ
ncbi:hypothetical protein OBBRIDRAFT_389014 [Obba rivulosa]|uniref:Uncharacterized protein n=1 Tax=Obba rivulosa TaxID=1052685 RepID=A0A8E2AQ17_9APHY|nr:hypothetical protein OBBRIDRAFT_389014 [Obba rivulosa]